MSELILPSLKEDFRQPTQKYGLIFLSLRVFNLFQNPFLAFLHKLQLNKLAHSFLLRWMRYNFVYLVQNILPIAFSACIIFLFLLLDLSCLWRSCSFSLSNHCHQFLMELRICLLDLCISRLLRILNTRTSHVKDSHRSWIDISFVEITFKRLIFLVSYFNFWSPILWSAGRSD